VTTIAGQGKEISEKSLELNVCAELLQYIRSWPGCGKALWLGLTQRQERLAGIDELIRNVGVGFSLMLQFKAPWPSSRVDDLYKFSINERQHEALEQLAGQYPGAVYYVFPLYSKWSKADQHAPDLSQDTWLVPVSSIPSVLLSSLASPSSGRHRVDLQRIGPQVRVTVHSPEVVGEAINAKEYFGVGGRSLSPTIGSTGVPSDQLRAWVSRLDRQDFALRFRGLNALFVPRG